MSIRALKTFLTVVKYGTFAAAAKHIGLTQAAVSLQIKGIEEEFKTRIFDRSSRSVVLNTAGRNLVARAAEIVRLYEDMTVTSSSDEFAGRLNVGAVATTFAKLLPEGLLRLKRAHPRIEVRIISGPSDLLAIKVESGELDAALASDPPLALPSNLTWHPIAREPLALLAPAKVKVNSARDLLAMLPYIRITRQSWTGRLIDDALKRNHIIVNDTMELDSLQAAVEMVGQGLGISIMPLYEGKWQDDPRLRIWVIDKPRIERTIGLIERRTHTRTIITAALRDCLRGQEVTTMPRQQHTISLGRKRYPQNDKAEPSGL